MNAFETTVAIERRRGYFPNLCVTKDCWECRMECGVDVLPAATPRPRGCGITAMAALTEAIRARDRIVAELTKKMAMV